MSQEVLGMTVTDVYVFSQFFCYVLILSSDCCPALTSIKLPWMTLKIFLTLCRLEGKQGQCVAGFLLAVPEREQESWGKAGGGS